MSKVVSVKELAKFLKMNVLTVYRLVNAGEIPGKKFGKQWRFDLDEFKALIKKGETQLTSRRKSFRSNKKTKGGK
jgi:excisionase family DNA binding protein